ncbi:hypothetical protein CN568_03395 [Bacillus pseudomycoides]|uniref:Uncharacterized protein n=1 Tax=Bacillus pseudomycoides TaxID=64104 RepID=A0ABD6TAC2_9BACI|nr:hypothetical protein CON70_01690 [Bacillus pseudomycoides]PDZ74732.1 hypothetical protein CON58_06010 [Bacillus pseudomycoides]PEE06022.1 hypothetical protein CON86_12525 [Bacillus pseudomycoides]PEF24640.1 hypothetical protein CON69_11445 [Bacillus pseudomycoides]PEJ26494.1 hypothetical protein CN887_09215 [Bacillus pseudomycoides]
MLIFQHISRCYEKTKVTCTRSLFLFSLDMGQEKGLPTSMHGWMLFPTLKERFYVGFSICIYIFF